MPKRPKINLDKVKASLVTRCAKCGYGIPPAEIRRISTSEIRCPKCGATFNAEKGRGPIV